MHSSITHVSLLSVFISLLTGCQTTSDGFVYEEINPVLTHRCDNDITVKCYGSACTADINDDHERVSALFDEAGSLYVCVRSGCWEGQADVSNSDGFIILTGENVKFTSKNSSHSVEENIAIILDNNDYIAILKAGIFSQPLFCN